MVKLLTPCDEERVARERPEGEKERGQEGARYLIKPSKGARAAHREAALGGSEVQGDRHAA